MSGLGKITLTVFLGLVVALAVYVLIGRAYASHRVFTAEKDAPISLTAAPGEQVVLQVKIHDTINGFWASPTGVQLVAPGRPAITLVQARKPFWGKSVIANLTSGDLAKDIIVGGKFTVPYDPAAGAVAGKLQGTVTYPEGGIGGFSNTNDRLANQVKITVVPSGALSVWASGRAMAVIECLTLALAVVLVGCLLRLLIRDALWDSVGLKRWLTSLLSLVLFGGIAFMIGFAVQVFATTGGKTSGTPAPLPLVSFWVLPVLTGLAGMVAIAARLTQD